MKQRAASFWGKLVSASLLAVLCMGLADPGLHASTTPSSSTPSRSTPSGSTAAAASSSTSGTAAATGPYAPLDRPGPALTVPVKQLQSSLTCTANVPNARQNPVLLVAGTTMTPDVNFSWNYERAFTQQSIPWCAVTLPNHEMSDIQTAGEYIVYAIRHISALSGRKVDILGYSQGGMAPRWALRFWPDTRKDVDDFVAIDPSNHGTLDADAACTVGCAPAVWQQQTDSHFLQALNSGAETFAGISYTVIYSRADEVVFPNLDAAGSSSLHTGQGAIRNIAVQSICPADVSDHLAMGSIDPVAYALAMDAFTHAGPADPSRISPTVCTSLYMPGVDPSTFLPEYLNYLSTAGTVMATYPHTQSEPPLGAYVYAQPVR